MTLSNRLLTVVIAKSVLLFFFALAPTCHMVKLYVRERSRFCRIKRKEIEMVIKNKKAWQRATWDYQQLGVDAMVPFLAGPLSQEEMIARLEKIVRKCPQFYPAILDLSLRKLSLGGDRSGEQEMEKGFHLMLELAEPHEIGKEIDILLDNLEKFWRLDLSKHCLEVLIKRYPENALYHDSYASVLGQMGEVDKALLHSEKAIRLEPKNQCFLSNQGWILLMAGDLEKAGPALESALALDSENDVTKGNIEVYRFLTEQGGTYFDYLLRPFDEQKMEELMDQEDWEEVDMMCASYDSSRFEAFAIDYLQNRMEATDRLPELMSTLRVFFQFVRKVDQDVHLNEDIEFMDENFKPIMYKFIYKFGDVDKQMVEGIYTALLEYYGFLAAKKLIPAKAFRSFRQNILGIKKELISKMTKYNAVRHDDSVAAQEKEAIREQLFEGHHQWPFL